MTGILLSICSQKIVRMYLGLDKKVVLVTGGSRGIGRATVESFLKEGATVHFCSRTPETVQKANEDLAKKFPDAQAIGVVLDVGDVDKLVQWVERCAQESSRIDVVVANVSSFHTEDVADHWEKTFQTDWMGTWQMIQTAIPHLEKSKGNIVTIASVSGRDIDFTAPGPYGPMKACMIHYTQGLANRIAGRGVRANVLSPGNIFTDVFAEIETGAPEFFKTQLDKNPMGRLGTPAEIADCVVFLASERASFVSGANFVVDGALCTGVQL
ncbi:Hypothetical protein R9X50_00763700 [Acrodontium crateriforme]|uniref:Uncharacterized protein n=1 Tax=Acrodontium crateriforme TaxID=150365 RepID=A0AAQ3ME24_9PEZI|nr:Hypothetical protein R9X50_00763700 [Acrodontium crateriforme]